MLLVAAAACAKPDLKSELDQARSWTATTQLAVDRRSAGATNRAVTSQLLDRAQRATVEAERQFATLAKSDSERTAARGVLDSLHEGIARLQRVVR